MGNYIDHDAKTWVDVTKPIVDRWRLCAKMDLHYHENPRGCEILAEIVSTMAELIDARIEEIDRRERERMAPRCTGAWRMLRCIRRHYNRNS